MSERSILSRLVNPNQQGSASGQVTTPSTAQSNAPTTAMSAGMSQAAYLTAASLPGAYSPNIPAGFRPQFGMPQSPFGQGILDFILSFFNSCFEYPPAILWTGSYVYEKRPVQRKSTTFPNRGVENVKLDIFNPKILITRRVFIEYCSLLVQDK
jgi:hypothetical protein